MLGPGAQGPGGRVGNGNLPAGLLGRAGGVGGEGALPLPRAVRSGSRLLGSLGDPGGPCGIQAERRTLVPPLPLLAGLPLTILFLVGEFKVLWAVRLRASAPYWLWARDGPCLSKGGSLHPRTREE